MKQLFIFFLLLLFGFGCANKKSINHQNSGLVLRAEAEEWRSSAPGTNDFTEHGTDLTIELSNQLNGAQFRHIIYNGRKSFPVTVDTTKNYMLLLHTKVIYESELLSETSSRSDLSDRIVFQNENGKTDFLTIYAWTKKPLAYR